MKEQIKGNEERAIRPAIYRLELRGMLKKRMALNLKRFLAEELSKKYDLSILCPLRAPK